MQRGFTLIELLVVVTIVAVGSSLAYTGVSQMIANSRVQGAAQSILDGLQMARGEAVRRNTPVSFSLRPDGIGWTVTQVSSSETLRAFRDPDWTGLSIDSAGAASSVTFLATGLLQTGGTPLSQVTVSAPVGEARTRRVNVFGGGLIRMCDPAITADGDPRRC